MALYGPFKFAENRRPISPIFWICPQEDIVFQKPIEVVLPHILSNLTQKDVECFGVKFTKADHVDYTTDGNGKKKYKFRSLEDAKSEFTSGVNESYGILKTDHCCFFCITAIQDDGLTHELALRKGFCLTCVECTAPHATSHQKNVIYFCLSFMLPSCLDVRLARK